MGASAVKSLGVCTGHRLKALCRCCVYGNAAVLWRCMRRYASLCVVICVAMLAVGIGVAVLPRPVIPRSHVVSTLKKLMALLPAVHTARIDAQHARVVAVLRSKKLEAGRCSCYCCCLCCRCCFLSLPAQVINDTTADDNCGQVSKPLAPSPRWTN